MFAVQFESLKIKLLKTLFWLYSNTENV